MPGTEGSQGQGEVELKPGFESNPEGWLQKFPSSKITSRSWGGHCSGRELPEGDSA